MSKKLLPAILFSVLNLIVILQGSAQFNLGFENYNELKVVHGSDTLQHPWSGGLNNPLISQLDINLDGEEDLILYERDGEIFRGFIWQEGSTYQGAPDLYRQLPDIEGSFVLFRDYDGDGKQDLISSGFNNNGIDIYKNVSTEEEVKFELTGNDLTFRVPGQGNLFFYIPPNDLPAIQDLNGDGDLDILLQGQTGLLSYPALLYFENQSQEKYGNSDSLEFELANPCWGRIREFISSSGWTPYPCDTSNIGPNTSRHGGTTLTLFDVNGDGLQDAISGDAYTSYLRTLINVNEDVDAVVDLSQSDSTFPAYSTPAFLPTLSAAFMVDVDHDEQQDMMVTPNQLTASATFYLDTSINTDVDWYYRNTGTTAAPFFELEKRGFLSGEMVDVGAKSMPALADVNGDGLLDLIIGNEGYTVYGGSAAASLTLYLNIGSVEEPIFKLHEKDFADVAVHGFGHAHPTLADLDDDGDNDLIVGDDQGRLHFFRNKGTASTYDFHLTEPEFAGIDVELSAHPQFFDGNQDGIPDLMIGDYYGRVHYYENEGSATEHDFSKNAKIPEIGDILTWHDHGGESTPYFTRRLDSLGSNLYMLLSNADGVILVYGPIDDISSLDQPMEPADSIVVDATFASITGNNLFGDFRHELLIGQRTGGIYALRRTKDIPLFSKGPARPTETIDAYPNPNQGLFSIDVSSKEEVNISLQSANGARIHALKTNRAGTRLEIDIRDLPDGVYLLQVITDGEVSHSRVVKQ